MEKLFYHLKFFSTLSKVDRSVGIKKDAEWGADGDQTDVNSWKLIIVNTICVKKRKHGARLESNSKH